MRVTQGMAALLMAMAVVTVSPAAAPAEEGEFRDRGTGEHPGTGERPVAPWNGERGFLELERLQAEVRTLRALAGAQEALLAWNRARTDSGHGPAVLPEALCNEPGIGPWCRALPATFGPDAGRLAAGEPEEDER